MISILVNNLSNIVIFSLCFFYFMNSFYSIRKYLRKYFRIHAVVVLAYIIVVFFDLTIKVFILFYIVMYTLSLFYVYREKFRKGDVYYAYILPAAMNAIFVYVIYMFPVTV